MSNRHRLHVPGGTYYVFRRTAPRHPMFINPAEYARFEELLPVALTSANAKLLAYCWLPESVHFVIEIDERPVALFMRDLMWRYSRTRWQRADENRPWFRERYHATLVQPDVYLKALCCHLHYLPVHAGLSASPEGYAYSSHAAYLGRRSGPAVRTRKLLGLMGSAGNEQIQYIRAMAEAPPDSLRMLFERGAPDTPGVVGDKAFLSRQSIAAVARPSRPPARYIEKVIAHIAERQALTVADICSHSRRRELVIARAQIVWLTTRWNIGTLSDVARHLRHSPSAMTRAVARYRYRRPDLFPAEKLLPAQKSTHNLPSAIESHLTLAI